MYNLVKTIVQGFSFRDNYDELKNTLVVYEID